MTVTPEQWADLRRLYDLWLEATARAGGVLMAEGMNSAAFLEADRTAGDVRREYEAKARQYGVELFGPSMR